MKTISIMILFSLTTSFINAQPDSTASISDKYDYLVQKTFLDAKKFNRYSNSDSSNCKRDSLYTLIVAVLDSVYKTVKDDRIDSIYHFLKHRIRVVTPREADTLGFYNFVVKGKYEVLDSQVIYICPLFKYEHLQIHEVEWGEDGGMLFLDLEKKGVELGARAAYLHSLRLITIRKELPFPDQFSFFFGDLAYLIYHEGHHAWLCHNGDIRNTDAQHEEMYTLDRKMKFARGPFK